MCSTKGVGKFLQKSDPAHSLVTKNFGNNDLVKFTQPIQTVAGRMAEGEKVSGSMLADPGAFASKTQKQKDAVAYAAAAPQRAADASLTDANNSLAKLRSRRRSAGALSTGATAGGGQISSILAYGQSTLG